MQSAEIMEKSDYLCGLYKRSLELYKRLENKYIHKNNNIYIHSRHEYLCTHFTYGRFRIPNAFSPLYKLRNLKNCLFQAHYTFILHIRVSCFVLIMAKFGDMSTFCSRKSIFLTFPFSIFVQTP